MSYYRSKGFTLIELLTVIAIIGILAGILIPVVGRVRESARTSTCISILRQYGVAFHMYIADNKELFPPGSSTKKWFDNLSPYLAVIKRTDVTGRSASCPSLVARFSNYSSNPTDHEIHRGYWYNRNLYPDSSSKPPPIPFSTISTPSRMLMVWDARSFGPSGDDVSGYPGTGGGRAKYRHNGRGNFLMVSGAVIARRGNYNPDETTDDTAIPYASGGINWGISGEPFYYSQ